MRYFHVVVFRPELAEEDQGQFPPGLVALAVRGPEAAGRPDTGVILFDRATEDDFGRIVEALWLDRHVDPKPKVQRKLYLIGDEVYLQVGAPDSVKKVGERGPIRGAVEGFRHIFRTILDRLESAPVEEMPTPLGARRARHLAAKLPEPGGPTT